MFSLKVDDKLEIALPTDSGIQKAFEIIKENYDFIYEWMPWINESLTFENIRDFYKTTLRKFAEDGDEIGLQIVYKNKIVGGTGFHNIDRQSKSAEIGYWLAKNATGKGIVTKSVKCLLDYGFNELNLNRIVIKCVPTNIKSRAIPERLGFTQEGIEREAGWLHTRFVDHAVYSMLAKEWREKVKNKQTKNKE